MMESIVDKYERLYAEEGSTLTIKVKEEIEQREKRQPNHGDVAVAYRQGILLSDLASDCRRYLSKRTKSYQLIDHSSPEKGLANLEDFDNRVMALLNDYIGLLTESRETIRTDSHFYGLINTVDRYRKELLILTRENVCQNLISPT